MLEHNFSSFDTRLFQEIKRREQETKDAKKLKESSSKKRYKDLEAKQRSRYTQIKHSAASRSKVFSLTFDQFILFWQKPCHYCGNIHSNVGLDRIDSTKGYSLDNVVPCCSICNVMKWNLTAKEFYSHIEKICAKRLSNLEPEYFI